MDGSGPAIAVIPAEAPAGSRDRLRAALLPDEPVPDGTAVIVATSGSTGDPAGVVLPAHALRAAAEAFTQRSGVPRGHRWVAALPLHSIGGLMVAVRALVAGDVPVAVDSLGGAARFTVDGFAAATERARALGSQDGRPLAVSLVPPMLAALDAAQQEGWDLLSAYDAVLVGGAAAPRSLVERLRGLGVRIRLSYGMSETCGGVVFDGRPLAGTHVRADEEGRLRIRGPQVALGYRRGRDSWRWSSDSEGIREFTTSDVGVVHGDGTVEVTGRCDDIVQVGGSAVSLPAVREALQADPRVAAAEVVALPAEAWGAEVVAFVVPAAVSEPDGVPAEPDIARELAAHVVEALGRPARPRAFHLVPELPMLGSGKVDRHALVDMAADPLSSGR